MVWVNILVTHDTIFYSVFINTCFHLAYFYQKMIMFVFVHSWWYFIIYALTAAEKQKRFNEKFKCHPDKYKWYKKKRKIYQAKNKVDDLAKKKNIPLQKNWNLRKTMEKKYPFLCVIEMMSHSSPSIVQQPYFSDDEEKWKGIEQNGIKRILII